MAVPMWLSVFNEVLVDFIQMSTCFLLVDCRTSSSPLNVAFQGLSRLPG